MQEIRIRFSKTGTAKYISHLDLMRCFSRAFARADIPLWYTEGFNPRPYLNFTMPLSLGVEGLREAVDIRLEQAMEPEELVTRLGAVMPPDIRIVSAGAPVHKMTEIAESHYVFTVEQDTLPSEEFAAALRRTAELPSLPVEKRAKHGRQKIMKTINLAEYCKNFSAEAGGAAENGGPAETGAAAGGAGTVTIRVTLPSSPQFGVNPKLFLDKFLSETGVDPIRVRMVREALYCGDDVPFE